MIRKKPIQAQIINTRAITIITQIGNFFAGRGAAGGGLAGTCPEKAGAAIGGVYTGSGMDLYKEVTVRGAGAEDMTVAFESTAAS
jgi:hypothetical protein